MFFLWFLAFTTNYLFNYFYILYNFNYFVHNYSNFEQSLVHLNLSDGSLKKLHISQNIDNAIYIYISLYIMDL